VVITSNPDEISQGQNVKQMYK